MNQPEELPVKDTREDDAKAIAEENAQLKGELQRVNDGMNVALAILSGLYLQPYTRKEYLCSDEVDHVSYALMSLLYPVALAMGGDGETASQLSRLVSMCLNYWVTTQRVATPGAVVEWAGRHYEVYEGEGLVAYLRQRDGDGGEFDGKPLQELLTAMKGDSNGVRSETPGNGEAGVESGGEESANG